MQTAQTVDCPADDIFGRRKNTGAVFADIELMPSGSGVIAEDKLTDLVLIGIGELPISDHGGHGILRRRRVRRFHLLRKRYFAPQAARNDCNNANSPMHADYSCQ